MCTADAPEFQSWRISREDLFHHSCNYHFGRLWRHAFHAHIEIVVYIDINVVLYIYIDVVFNSAERKREHRVCSRQYNFRSASQPRMDRVCAPASLVWHLPVMLR